MPALDREARSSSVLARFALLHAALLALAGSALGVFAILHRVVTGVETVVVLSSGLFSSGLLVTFIVFPRVKLQTLATVSTTYYALYLSAGMIVALGGWGNRSDVFTYMVWFFPLLVLNNLVNSPSVGRFLARFLIVAPLAILVAFSARLISLFPVESLILAVSGCLSYICFGLMLNAVSRYREAYIVERERAESMRIESELRKLAEQSLRESEQRFRLVVEDAPLGILIQSGGIYKYLNPAAIAMFGAESADQIVGHSVAERIHPEYQAAVGERIRVSKEEGGMEPVLEEQFLRLDGTVFDVEVTAKPFVFDGQESSIVFVRDITKHKREERALRESEERFRLVVEGAPVGMYIQADGAFRYLNRAALNMFGAESVGQMAGQRILDRIHPDHRAAVTERARIVKQERKQVPPHEERRLRLDGSAFDAENTATPIFFEGRDGAVVFFSDITERKQAERALRRSEERFRQFAENIREVFWVVPLTADEEPYVSPAYEQIWERSCESLLENQSSWIDGVHPDDREESRLRFAAQLAGKNTDFEYRIRTPDGREKWIRDRAFPIRDHRGQLIRVVGIAEEITEQKRLIELSRLSGMAEVATGVLHNVGNVLNSINVSTTIVADRLQASRVGQLSEVARLFKENTPNIGEFLTDDPKGQRLLPYLDKLSEHLVQERDELCTELEGLVEHVGHVKEIVAMQQTYARTSGVLEIVAFHSLIEDALRMTQSEMDRHGVQLRKEIEAVPMITTDRHKVLQILLNLLRNAKDAVKAGLTMPREITVRVDSIGTEGVRFQLMDNGVGIPTDNLARIFVHGFTTKKEGHGFGLHSGALAAQQLGGSLSAKSGGLGCGATFTLELPLHPASERSTQ